MTRFVRNMGFYDERYRFRQVWYTDHHHHRHRSSLNAAFLLLKTYTTHKHMPSMLTLSFSHLPTVYMVMRTTVVISLLQQSHISNWKEKLIIMLL